MENDSQWPSVVLPRVQAQYEHLFHLLSLHRPLSTLHFLPQRRSVATRRRGANVLLVNDPGDGRVRTAWGIMPSHYPVFLSC